MSLQTRTSISAVHASYTIHPHLYLVAFLFKAYYASAKAQNPPEALRSYPLLSSLKNHIFIISSFFFLRSPFFFKPRFQRHISETMRNTIFHEPELTGSLSDAWKQIRVNFIVPFLYLALYTCVAMSLMLFVERLYMTAVILCVKMLGKKRSTQYKVDVVLENMERNGTHPIVLVQIPCFVMQRVSIWEKIHLVYAFFFVRKIIAHWVTFFFYCVVIPACVLIPEVHLPKALAIYIPAIITLLNTARFLDSVRKRNVPSSYQGCHYWTPRSQPG